MACLKSPKKIATTQMTIPPFDFPITDSINPIIANSMFSHIIHHSNGIIPINSNYGKNTIDSSDCIHFLNFNILPNLVGFRLSQKTKLAGA